VKLVLLIENYLTKKSRSGCYKRFVFSNRKVKISLSKRGDAKYTYCIAGRPWFRPLGERGEVFNFLFATFLSPGQSPTNDHEFN